MDFQEMGQRVASEDEAELSADELEEHILSAELTPKGAAAAEALVEACQYTTTALFALELRLRELDDEEGANMIGEFCRRFAKHEASTL
jgi:hypothetical protein